MAKPNYQFEKRRREAIKKKKQDEKRQRKLEKSASLPDGDEPQESPDPQGPGQPSS